MSSVPDFTKIPARPTPEGIERRGVYHAQDVPADAALQSLPGMPPYVRGPYTTMYVRRPWTIRQ